MQKASLYLVITYFLTDLPIYINSNEIHSQNIHGAMDDDGALVGADSAHNRPPSIL
jgi:hypothetical protein